MDRLLLMPPQTIFGLGTSQLISMGGGAMVFHPGKRFFFQFTWGEKIFFAKGGGREFFSQESKRQVFVHDVIIIIKVQTQNLVDHII